MRDNLILCSKAMPRCCLKANNFLLPQVLISTQALIRLDFLAPSSTSTFHTLNLIPTVLLTAPEGQLPK